MKQDSVDAINRALRRARNMSRPDDPRFGEGMTVAQAFKLLDDKGSVSDPIFYAAEAEAIDAAELRDRVDDDEKAAGVRIRYYGGTTLTAAHVVLCEGSLRDMVLERHGRAPGKQAATCAVCGGRSDFPGSDRCANCWEVERRLAEYLRSTAGRTFVRAALAEADSASEGHVLKGAPRAKAGRIRGQRVKDPKRKGAVS